MMIISRLSDLTIEERHMCDDLLTVLLERNYPLNAPSLTTTRDDFWIRVFDRGWNTATPNPPAPPTVRKRTLDETGLYIGMLNKDAPATRGNNIPIHRRAGQPVLYKAGFMFGGDLHFVWVDQNGQRVPPDSVDIDGGMTIEDIQETVGQHYDSNEVDRVGQWNWAKVIYWGRARLIAAATQQPLPEGAEDIKELVQIRTTEQAAKEEEDDRLEMEEIMSGRKQ